MKNKIIILSLILTFTILTGCYRQTVPNETPYDTTEMEQNLKGIVQKWNNLLEIESNTPLTALPNDPITNTQQDNIANSPY